MPPKCNVRRLRSVLHVHLEESLRKRSMLCSSLGLMKSISMVKPGTGVLLRVKVCFVSSFPLVMESDRLCTVLEHLLTGLKNSLMVLRFLLGGSIVQYRSKNRRYLSCHKIRSCFVHFQPRSKQSLYLLQGNLCLKWAQRIKSTMPITVLNDMVRLIEATRKFILRSSNQIHASFIVNTQP